MAETYRPPHPDKSRSTPFGTPFGYAERCNVTLRRNGRRRWRFLNPRRGTYAASNGLGSRCSFLGPIRLDIDDEGPTRNGSEYNNSRYAVDRVPLLPLLQQHESWISQRRSQKRRAAQPQKA